LDREGGKLRLPIMLRPLLPWLSHGGRAWGPRLARMVARRRAA
jgi:hypothetical protein